MRFSSSSGSSVGATQPLAALEVVLAPGVRFLRKSKPGTNLVKSKALLIKSSL